MTEVLTFAAMGTTGHLEVSGPRARRLARSAVARIGALEQRWSRFLPSSDVSRLNASGGTPVSVDPSTVGLLELAVAAWRGTDGKFSPFLQRAMLDIGYGRSLASGPIFTPSGRQARPRYVPLTTSPLLIDRQARTVTLDPGARLDLGGLAKGFSADLVLAGLLGGGAISALVDIGGDMAFASVDDDDRRSVSWTIAVDDPFEPGVAIDHLTALRGGVATSSTLRRRWTSPDGEGLHHLIDPTTGWSCATDVVAVTVLADSCANAEARPNWQLDLHRYQGALSVSMLALHISALVADTYSHFTLSGIFIPFASSWKPLPVALGIVAMYLLITVEVTSLLRKRLSERVWHTIHLSSLVAYLLSTAHFFQAGTDHRRAPALLAIVAMNGLNLGLLSFRILAEPRARRAVGRPPRVAPTDPQACNDVMS